jgi:hypothetical protein
MTYETDDTPDDDSQTGEDEITPLVERLSMLRSSRGSAGGYSPEARQRIEYLQELRRLRSQIGDDGIDTF